MTRDEAIAWKERHGKEPIPSFESLSRTLWYWGEEPPIGKEDLPKVVYDNLQRGFQESKEAAIEDLIQALMKLPSEEVDVKKLARKWFFDEVSGGKPTGVKPPDLVINAYMAGFELAKGINHDSE